MRTEARTASLNAIKGMMAALMDILDGETLKGAPNLVGGGDGSRPYRGYRVRTAAGKWDAGLEWPEGDFLGHEALVINIHGQLRFAALGRDVLVKERAASDDDLISEDAEKLANTLAIALQRHIAKCERGDARYRRMRRFSDAVATAIVERGSRTTEPRGSK